MNELHLFAGAVMKCCSSCKVEKPDDLLYRRGAGRQNQCIECAKAAAAAWYSSNPDYRKQKAKAWREANPGYVSQYRKDNRRKIYLTESARKYGITPERYEQMIASQDNKCAVCLKLFDWSDQQTKPLIDHCHNSMKVRGLLCNRCNTTLGLVEDRKDLLAALMEYLNCHG